MIAFDTDETVRAIAEGRYHDALGVPQSADRLEIEVAAARLGDERNDIAQAIGGIVQFLTVPEKLEIYRIACHFRDAVIDGLRCRYGEGFLDPRRYIAVRVWFSVQYLLRCDGEKGGVRIGPRAAGSLASEGQAWIIEEVVNSGACSVANFTPEERNRGYAVRFSRYMHCPFCQSTGLRLCSSCDGNGQLPESGDGPFVNFAPDFPNETAGFVRDACQDCEGMGSTPCDCQDDFAYAIPGSARPGDVIPGTGMRTGRSEYLLFEGPAYSARPSRLLEQMHQTYNFGKNLGFLGRTLGSETFDITLDEARRRFHQRNMVHTVLMAAACSGIGAAIGASRGAEAWGAVTGLLCLLPAWAALLWLNRISANPVNRQTQRLLVPVFALVPPLTGLVLGYLASSWLVGVMIGGSIVCLWALHEFLILKLSTLLR